MQIATLLAKKTPALKLRYIDVQMQSGESDCGIFAIAFATALIHGHHPGKYIFQQSLMHKNLLTCPEKGQLIMFPIKGAWPKKLKKQTEIVPMNCTCRLPELPGYNWIRCYTCIEYCYVCEC